MVTFIVLTVGLCAASYLLGVRALPDAAATVAKSGDPLGELVFDLREPTARFMERAMSTSLTDALVNVNETLTRDAGIPAMLGNLILLRATINGLSNTSSMLDTVGGLEAAVNGLPPREATAGNLSAFHNSTQTLKSLLPRQSDALNQLEAQVPTLQDAAASHRLTAVSVRGRHAAPHVRSGPHPRPPPLPSRALPAPAVARPLTARWRVQEALPSPPHPPRTPWPPPCPRTRTRRRYRTRSATCSTRPAVAAAATTAPRLAARTLLAPRPRTLPCAGE